MIFYIIIENNLTEEDITFKQGSIWGNNTSWRWVSMHTFTYTHTHTYKHTHTHKEELDITDYINSKFNMLNSHI